MFRKTFIRGAYASLPLYRRAHTHTHAHIRTHKYVPSVNYNARTTINKSRRICWIDTMIVPMTDGSDGGSLQSPNETLGNAEK